MATSQPERSPARPTGTLGPSDGASADRTIARTDANAVLMPMNLHLPPGRQTPSNKPCSNRWTLIEKASIRWRIDYRLSSQGLTGRALWAVAERAASHGERWSDHAPVTVAYDHEA